MTPIPERLRHGGRQAIYPWATMEVGEMFFVLRKRNTMGQLAWSRGKKLDRKFSTRLCWMTLKNKKWVAAEPEAKGASLGVGVWRVE